MKALSLKLRDEVFREVEEMVKKIQSSRNAYINDALKFYNRVNQRRLLKERFAQESKLVRPTSMEFLAEVDEWMDEGLA